MRRTNSSDAALQLFAALLEARRQKLIPPVWIDGGVIRMRDSENSTVAPRFMTHTAARAMVAELGLLDPPASPAAKRKRQRQAERDAWHDRRAAHLLPKSA